jgi:glycosyltransferase involved in cell wall biosynthesis
MWGNGLCFGAATPYFATPEWTLAMINVEFSGTEEPWRRWFDGPVRLHEGAAIATSELAVVVIGFKAQENLAAAVASLQTQQPAEIVVVNSGGGDVRGKLGPLLEQVRLIEIEAPLLVGAARNIGIDASRAPYVAFLAGDCLAAPGWVAARLEAHRAGARAVASAVAPPEGAGYWTRAAHLFLFGTRAPQVPAATAQRYGASYDRLVFAKAGYFNPALRIGEDSDLVERLGSQLIAAWNRRVVTIHDGPADLPAFIRDLYARGRRVARYQLRRRTGQPLADFIKYMGARNALALRLARDGLRLPVAEINRLRPALWLGSLAYVAGVWRGFFTLDRAKAELKRSHDALNRADLLAAIDHAGRAVARNGEDIPTLLRFADLLRRDPVYTQRLAETLRRIGWLSAFQVKHQLALGDWLLEREMLAEATAFAELCKLGTPGDTALHLRLAEAAERRGDTAGLGLEPVK